MTKSAKIKKIKAIINEWGINNNELHLNEKPIVIMETRTSRYQIEDMNINGGMLAKYVNNERQYYREIEYDKFLVKDIDEMLVVVENYVEHMNSVLDQHSI